MSNDTIGCIGKYISIAHYLVIVFMYIPTHTSPIYIIFVFDFESTYVPKIILPHFTMQTKIVSFNSLPRVPGSSNSTVRLGSYGAVINCTFLMTQGHAMIARY